MLHAAWILARAGAPGIIGAVLAYGWAVLMLLPAAVRGGLYMDEKRSGIVIIQRSRLLLDVLIQLVAVLPLIPLVGLLFGLGLQLVPHAPLAFPAYVLAWLLVTFIGYALMMPEPGGALLPFGPETPPGDRWEISALAQLPGTRLTAVQLTHQVIETVVPPGAVLVAMTYRRHQLGQYVRAGFTAGKRRRVYRVVG